MEGFMSLTLFTTLAQAAAGMALLKALFCDYQSKEKLPCWLASAIVLAGLATLMSLFHLSAPFSAYYTITNAPASWLSLEILSVGLFGGLLLAYYFVRTKLIRYLAGAAGLLMIYAMSNVYMIEHIVAWNTYLTFISFLTTALLLGSSTLFVIDLMASRKSELELKKVLHGSYPIIIAISLSAHLLVASLQYDLHTTSRYLCIFLTQYVLLLLGALIGFITIIRNPVSKNDAPYSCKITGLIGLAVLLIWVGAINGRVLFYMGYSYFGM